MDKYQNEERVMQVMEDSQEYIQRYFSCLPDELDKETFAAIMVSALHFSALIAQLDSHMSKKDFIKLTKEAWGFVLKNTEKRNMEEASEEVLH